MGFINKYFIEPTITQSGYNIVNTTVYSIIFILCLITVIKIFDKRKIRVSEKFWFDLLPFVFLGGIFRTLFDLNFFSALGPAQYLFISPLIYFTVLFLVVACMLVEKFYKNFLRRSGIVLALFFGINSILHGKNIDTFVSALVLSSAVFIGLLLVLRLFRQTHLVKGINSHIIFGHILDACTACIAVSMGYREAQILSAGLISISPVLFVFVKLLVPLLLLHHIKSIKGNTKFFLKFALLIIGLPQGVHNSLFLFVS